LCGYSDWPGLGQVFKVERQRTIRGQTTTEVSYGVTSLDRSKADAAQLLKLSRGHWGIENRLFHVRDVTLGEDACRVRSGHAPQNLSTIRNIILHLLHAAGHRNKAAALRRHAAHPTQALTLLMNSS
jgi:predicted transposase YbfD/YdcC